MATDVAVRMPGVQLGGAEVDIVKPLQDTEKPSTVLFRALEKAKEEKYDVLIIDTSGRLSNNYALNEELKKMRRVVNKAIDRDPHDTLLVVDASIGRNAVDQAQTWQEEVGVSGVIITKLDGTARAGYVVGMTRDLGLPVKLIGVGEKIDDLQDFDPPAFVDALLGYDAEASAALQKRLDTTMARTAPAVAAEVAAPSLVVEAATSGGDNARKSASPGEKKKKKKKKKKK